MKCEKERTKEKKHQRTQHKYGARSMMHRNNNNNDDEKELNSNSILSHLYSYRL